jgi:hypothetical protein
MVCKVVGEGCGATGTAAMLLERNEPASQRHMQSHSPFDSGVPDPRATPPADPMTGGGTRKR